MFTHDDADPQRGLGPMHPEDSGDMPRWCAIDRAHGDRLRAELTELRAKRTASVRRFALGEIAEPEMVDAITPLNAAERELLARLREPAPISHRITIDDLAAIPGLTVTRCREHDADDDDLPGLYGKRDDDVPDHDCPRAVFLDDPITRYYGVGGEMLHLIACPVCDERERDQ